MNFSEILLMALFIIGFYSLTEVVRRYLDKAERPFISRKLSETELKIPLEKHLRFYQMLPVPEKAKFEKRVQNFIAEKQFIGRGIDVVTAEMQALIAGTAIQLTYGHPSIYFSHFKKILIYPDTYYSQISHTYHKGEVNAGGIIVLSWTNFVEGFINNDDGVNLGLHELAHALKLENAISAEENGFIDDDLLDRWTRLSSEEIAKAERGESNFFRAYAHVDSQEFFAVAVENFFERPQKFHDWNPELYNTLAAMLRQDTLKMMRA